MYMIVSEIEHGWIMQNELLHGGPNYRDYHIAIFFEVYDIEVTFSRRRCYQPGLKKKDTHCHRIRQNEQHSTSDQGRDLHKFDTIPYQNLQTSNSCPLFHLFRASPAKSLTRSVGHCFSPCLQSAVWGSSTIKGQLRFCKFVNFIRSVFDGIGAVLRQKLPLHESKLMSFSRHSINASCWGPMFCASSSRVMSDSTRGRRRSRSRARRLRELPAISTAFWNRTGSWEDEDSITHAMASAIVVAEFVSENFTRMRVDTLRKTLAREMKKKNKEMRLKFMKTSEMLERRKTRTEEKKTHSGRL